MPQYACLMVLRAFERRLEQMVEGTFARVFRSGLTPLEIGRSITREIDANRSAGVRRTTVVPNHFAVALAGEDHERFAQVEATLAAELAEAAIDHAAESGFDFMGPVVVEFERTDELVAGRFTVEPSFREAPPGKATIVYSTGHRVALGETPALVGRMSDCLIVLDDSNVSRHHAEFTPIAGGWMVRDLGSTNGTSVNGMQVVEEVLRHGDVVTFGSSSVTFEAR